MESNNEEFGVNLNDPRSCELLVALDGLFVELLLSTLTMIEHLLSGFPTKERTISPTTMPQALDQPDESVSPPTGRMRRKPNHSFKSVLPTFEDNISLKEAVSLLTNA